MRVGSYIRQRNTRRDQPLRSTTGRSFWRQAGRGALIEVLNSQFASQFTTHVTCRTDFWVDFWELVPAQRCFVQQNFSSERYSCQRCPRGVPQGGSLELASGLSSWMLLTWLWYPAKMEQIMCVSLTTVGPPIPWLGYKYMFYTIHSPILWYIFYSIHSPILWLGFEYTPPFEQSSLVRTQR